MLTKKNVGRSSGSGSDPILFSFVMRLPNSPLTLKSSGLEGIVLVIQSSCRITCVPSCNPWQESVSWVSICSLSSYHFLHCPDKARSCASAVSINVDVHIRAILCRGSHATVFPVSFCGGVYICAVVHSWSMHRYAYCDCLASSSYRHMRLHVVLLSEGSE